MDLRIHPGFLVIAYSRFLTYNMTIYNIVYKRVYGHTVEVVDG